uniref:Mitochondrial carrier protein n=1 Tax=Tetraselmis chuii TaxID=63592 RepID=A0A6U1KHJ4_9CHLO|mmetsp:Transcript_4548/g.8281  ORF Transcript_4548/g.8281 Transcript_4548/m.8281 type:complete len:415 (+) Transcript_4548:148-1392(+)
MGDLVNGDEHHVSARVRQLGDGGGARVADGGGSSARRSSPTLAVSGLADATVSSTTAGGQVSFHAVELPGLSRPISSSSPFAVVSAASTAAGVVLLSDTVRHICAGTAARTMAQVFVHPIDTVKTRMQVTNDTKRLTKWKASSVTFTIKGRPMQVQPNIFCHGFRDIYTGVSGALLGTVPTAFVYFWAYENSSKYLKDKLPEEWSQIKHVLSASAGALTSAFLRVPTDTIRHRVQAYMHPNVFDATVTILRQKGICGLYSGFLPTLCRDVPEIAIQFSAYEALRSMVRANRKDHEPLQTWEHLMLGGAAGALAATCTMPIDYMKTTMQCASGNVSMREIAAATMRERGPAGFFAGMGPRVAQTTIMSATFFGLFEFWKLQLKPAIHRDEGDKKVLPKLLTKRRDHVWKRQFVYR